MASGECRAGHPITIGRRALEFSLWPVRLGQGGWVTNTRLFVAEPWGIIRSAVETQCPARAKSAASAFLEQSADYYKAASAASPAAAKPLLLYYCYLNLAKALIVTRELRSSLDLARHGISEPPSPPGRRELVRAQLLAHPTTSSSVNIFDEFLKAVQGNGLNNRVTFDIPLLLKQVVTGHRLFVTASRGTRESFLRIAEMQMLDDRNGRLWVRMGFVAGDLRRLGITQAAFIQRSRLGDAWKRVSPPPDSAPGMIWFEQVATIPYTGGWLPQAVQKLIDSIRPFLWQTVLSTPPYRAYYLYSPAPPDHPQILPQLLSAYAILFYFGSITRYRPHHFDQILKSAYGPFVESFLHDQPAQMLFLIASEFARRDVTKAALV